MQVLLLSPLGLVSISFRNQCIHFFVVVVCFYWDAENLLRLEAGDSAFSLIQPGVELAVKLESGF